MGRTSLHSSWSFWVQLLKQHLPHTHPNPFLRIAEQVNSFFAWLHPRPQDSLLRLGDAGGGGGRGNLRGCPVARTRGLGPQPGASLPLAPEVRGRPEPGERGSFQRPETYQAGGRPPAAAAAAATAATSPGPRAPWRAEPALDAGGSRLRRAPALSSARTQLHAPRAARAAPSSKPRSVAPPGGRGGSYRAGITGCGLSGAAPPGPARLQPARRRGRREQEEGAGGRARTGRRGGGGCTANRDGARGLRSASAGAKFP